MERNERTVPVQKKWMKLGLVVAFLHYVFLLLVVVLLQVDLLLAVVVAVVASLIGGIALTVFVLFVY